MLGRASGGSVDKPVRLYPRDFVVTWASIWIDLAAAATIAASPCFLAFSYFPSAASITLSVFSCPLPEPQCASEAWQSDKPVTDFPSDCSQTCLSQSVRSGRTAWLRHQSPINILGESIFGRTLRGARLPSLCLISGATADFFSVGNQPSGLHSANWGLEIAEEVNRPFNSTLFLFVDKLQVTCKQIRRKIHICLKVQFVTLG